jgi:hypothetical protein
MPGEWLKTQKAQQVAQGDAKRTSSYSENFAVVYRPRGVALLSSVVVPHNETLEETSAQRYSVFNNRLLREPQARLIRDVTLKKMSITI